MKKFSASGLTAAGVLVLALGAGTVGGLLTAGGGTAASPPAQVQMGLKVAEEGTPPEVVATATPAPTMEAAPSPSEPETTAPAPTQEEPVAATKTESAKEAADRAEKAATRAETAADKAETAATPTPAPTPAPTPTPVSVTPVAQCSSGAVKNMGRWDEQVCQNGSWVSAAPNRHCKIAGTDPAYIESGATTKRTIGGKEYTYRCEDGQLAPVAAGE